MNRSADDSITLNGGGEFLNVALHCPAKQSSFSEWSTLTESANAVSGEKPSDYAFHTAKEENPWWSVDLKHLYEIEAIVISNRLGGWLERTRHLRVEIAPDERLEWQTLHAGYCVFGSKWTGDAFTIWLKGHVAARFVKLSLDDTEMFHLSQVEVFTSKTSVAFRTFCQSNQLQRLLEFNKSCPGQYIVSEPFGGPDEIVGLDINYSGRFGNLLIQFINAITLAERSNLKFIRLGKHELLGISHPIQINGITYLPFGAELFSKGRFLSGEFFNSDPFVPVLMPFLQFDSVSERNFTDVVQRVIRPNILRGIPLLNEVHHDDEVTIHIRSGDVFAPFTPIVRGYRQPPLSFYKLAVTRLINLYGIRRARLVFEDYGNPCVNAVIEWLESIHIPFRLQQGSVEQDMSALIDSPHLIFGHGTFGYAACRLSKHIVTLHYYEPELGGRYGSIPHIDHVYSVSDSGDYIEAYEYGKPFPDELGWFNTPENIATMLSYPLNRLSVREIFD